MAATPDDVEVALREQGYPPTLRVGQARALLGRYGLDLGWTRRRDIPLAEVAQRLRGLLEEGSK